MRVHHSRAVKYKKFDREYLPTNGKVYTADTIEDIRQLKNALNILEQSACEKDYKKQMKSRLFANDCSHNCYYITEN